MTKAMETRWFYHGPDDQIYGPYLGKEMFMWVQSGYFNESLPIRTDHEERFHPLGEWTRLCGGKVPFNLPVMSMDHLLSQLHHRPPMNPMMMLPPGLPHPYPPGPPPQTAQARYPFVNGMQSGQTQLGANGMGPAGPIISQPPSEPLDGGHSSASQTPDSDSELFAGENRHGLPPHLPQNQALNNSAGIHVGIQVMPVQKISTGSDPVIFPRSDASTQTTPLIVNSKDAARLLSQLLGHIVHVT